MSIPSSNFRCPSVICLRHPLQWGGPSEQAWSAGVSPSIVHTVGTGEGRPGRPKSRARLPVFVFELTSPLTGRADYTDERADYERFGVGNTGASIRAAVSATALRSRGTGRRTTGTGR